MTLVLSEQQQASTSGVVAPQHRHHDTCGVPRSLYACSATPLRFHTHRGQNIDLSADRTVAYRRSSYADSIVLSDRQLKPNELFLVKIDRNEIGWSGHLRVGLTNFNPESNLPLPRSALPDLCLTSRSWVVSVNLDSLSLVANGLIEVATIPAANDENNTPYVLPTDVGSRIGVYYSYNADGRSAQMRVVINQRDIGPMYASIPIDRPFYGVVDVYGGTKQVRTVGQMAKPPRLQYRCRQVILNSLRSMEDLNLLPVPDKIKTYLHTGAPEDEEKEEA